MGTTTSTPSSDLRELHWRVNNYRSLHVRAVEREAVWKAKAQELEEVVRRQAAKIAELDQQVEAFKAGCAWLEQQLFGRKSEKRKHPACGTPTDDQEVSDSAQREGDKPKKRGQQPGSNGHGRKRHPELPRQDIPHELPEEERRCPRCGKPFAVFPGTEDSEEIHWEVRLVCRVHKRSRYRPTCDCRAVPGIVTAPIPPKLIPKGMFSISFWAWLLLEKFLFQRPLHRARQVLALEGLDAPQGTLTGGLQRIQEILHPVYVRILEHSRTAKHRKMDETRWLVFVDLEGKKGHRWWLWVDITADTCVYIIDPTRSAEVLRKHLGENWEGIISADCFSSYKAHQRMVAELGGEILIAFCWAHRRRDFLKIRDGYRRLRPWAEAWLARIQELFALNGKRLAVRSKRKAFRREDQKLRKAIRAMEEVRERELSDPTLHVEQRKALESMSNHWDGLTLFVDHPEIPMDNNESERRLRNPIVGRKNYNGSGSIWSGMLCADAFTIFQTLLMNHIDPKQWLLDYFEACAKSGGRAPEDIGRFLPWNMPTEQKAAWRYPREPP